MSSNSKRSRDTARRHHYEGPSYLHEDQFVKARRQADQMVADGEAIMAESRDREARKLEFQSIKPRLAALRSTLGTRMLLQHPSGASAAARRAALSQDEVYRSLPEAGRRVVDAAIDEVTAFAQEGSGNLAVQRIAQLAEQMATSEGLAEWTPPASEAETPEALAALVPRS